MSIPCVRCGQLFPITPASAPCPQCRQTGWCPSCIALTGEYRVRILLPPPLEVQRAVSAAVISLVYSLVTASIVVGLGILALSRVYLWITGAR